MIRISGRAPVGERPVDHAPAGHRNTRPCAGTGSMHRASPTERWTGRRSNSASRASSRRRCGRATSSSSTTWPPAAPRGPRRYRGPVRVPSEVQPGPESHRDGFLEAEGAAAQDRRAAVRRPVEGRRERLPPVHPAGMHEPSCGGRI